MTGADHPDSSGTRGRGLNHLGPGGLASSRMGVIVTATVGLAIWIVLWSLKVSGFDSIMIAVTAVLIAVAARNVVPNLTRRRD